MTLGEKERLPRVIFNNVVSDEAIMLNEWRCIRLVVQNDSQRNCCILWLSNAKK